MGSTGQIGAEQAQAYLLSDGTPVTSLVRFSSPVEEFRAAFEGRGLPFLHYYAFKEGTIQERFLTRGEFWDLACSAAGHLANLGLSKGDRTVHCFSGNSPYDLLFRLASVLTGCVPVTVNWQADDHERIVYKATVTKAKVCLYDPGFAPRIEGLRARLPAVAFFEASEVERHPFSFPPSPATLSYDDERMVVFTSGTTGRPKGVSLSQRSFLTNRLTFEQYFGLSENASLDLLLVNPLHHSNSTALSDWGLRRRGAVIHLLESYTTQYWKAVTEAAERRRGLLVAPIVPRHIDFLESLAEQGKLPVDEARLKAALRHTDLLIGSAPVGPKTIERVLKFSGRFPHGRFGSTETCLQVAAIPTAMPEASVLRAFQAGWYHQYGGEKLEGYYIGREHQPFTRLKVVRSIDPESRDYLIPCEVGEPGYLLTQGGNLFSYYVGDEEATRNAFQDGWYAGLRDIGFRLENDDGNLDYYWLSRDSELLIRGGANYSYAQVAEELARFATDCYRLEPDSFEIAVVGIRWQSEHEDSCCVTLELSDRAVAEKKRLESSFLEEAGKSVSKGAKPDYLRIAPIPRNFKGVLYPQLKKEFLDWLKERPAGPARGR